MLHGNFSKESWASAETSFPSASFKSSVDPQIQFSANHVCSRHLWYIINAQHIQLNPLKTIHQVYWRHFIQDAMQIIFPYIFFLTLLNHCVLCLNHLASLNQLSWMGEVGHVITAGKMADLAHERSGQSTLWDQEHSKSEALEPLEIEFVSQ